MERKPIDLDAGWGYMERGITKLKRLLEAADEAQFTAEHYMNLYTTIYNMCTQKPPHDYSAELYERYGRAFSVYNAEQVLPSLQGQHGDFLLTEMWTRWSNTRVMQRWLARFFNYLDRYYITRHSLHSLPDVALLRFKDEVYVHVHVAARDAILSAVAAERAGERVDRPLLKNVLSIFIEVGMGGMDAYVDDFETALLDATSTHYRRQAASWIDADTCPEYMARAEAALHAEEARVDAYLHASTRPRLLAAAETVLLAEHADALLSKEGSGVAALLASGKRSDLGRMYRLFSRVSDGLVPVAAAFKAHVEGEGQALVARGNEAAASRRERGAGGATATALGGAAAAAAERSAGAVAEQQFVRDAVALHDKYLAYVADCFAGSSTFHKALKEAFEAFCNRSVGGAPVSELMAKYADTLLKRGGADKLTDDAADEALDKVVRLLAYISEKDMFAEYYRSKLARRLIGTSGANDDAERRVLAALKQQCGSQYTTKMEGMVTDIALARDKQAQFDEWRASRGGGGGGGVRGDLDVGVTVLTTGHWPNLNKADVALPPEMAAAVGAYQEFYEATTKHRKLAWHLQMGTATVRATFAARPLDLVVSTMQAAVLCLFNEAPDETLTYDQVRDRARLTDKDAVRVLASLSILRHKVLTKTGDGKRVAPGDSFAVNAAFTDRMRRVKIPLPSSDDKKRVVEDVSKDRQGAMDAAIVRIMKARRVMTHGNLVIETNNQLRRLFKPDMKAIKKTIESLIEREFLERDPEAAASYRYLA